MMWTVIASVGLAGVLVGIMVAALGGFALGVHVTSRRAAAPSPDTVEGGPDEAFADAAEVLR